MNAFLRGMASLFDFAGVLNERPHRRPLTPEEGAEADARAIASDWEAIGGDFRRAIEQYERERSKTG